MPMDCCTRRGAASTGISQGTVSDRVAIVEALADAAAAAVVEDELDPEVAAALARDAADPASDRPG